MSPAAVEPALAEAALATSLAIDGAQSSVLFKCEGAGLLPMGSGHATGDRLFLLWAFSSAVEHTLYMGEVARSIRAAPTITLSPGWAVIAAQ